MPRKARPDGTFPTREELLTINLKVTNQVAEGIKKYCPDAIVISIANPLDAIVYTLNKRLSPPKNKLMGMAGVLDSGRYCYFVAEAANVSVENVNAMVLGGHGDTMVPVRSSCPIAGIPVDKFLDDEDPGRPSRPAPARPAARSSACSASARRSSRPPGRRWRWPRRSSSTSARSCRCAPSSRASTASTACSSACPAILGKNGIEEVIELDLTDEEKEAFEQSAGAVRKTCDEVDEMLKKL